MDQTPSQPPPSSSSPAHDFHLVGLKANSVWSFSLLLSFFKKEGFNYITKICIFKRPPFKNNNLEYFDQETQHAEKKHKAYCEKGGSEAAEQRAFIKKPNYDSTFCCR